MVKSNISPNMSKDYQSNQGNANSYSNINNQNQHSVRANNMGNSNSNGIKVSALFFIFTVIAILVAGIFIYQYVENQKEIKRLKDPQYISELQDKQMKEVLDKIEQHVLITDSEKQSATIATIVDIESLKNENAEFYKNAQNGDRLIVFPTRAFIYRDTVDRIVNAASPIINPNQQKSNSVNSDEPETDQQNQPEGEEDDVEDDEVVTDSN